MNLAQTQAAWNKLFREAGTLFIRPIRFLKEARGRFAAQPLRQQLRQVNNVNLFVSSFVLTGGIVKPGTNADEDGEWFVRITDENPGANQALVSLYKAAGAGGGDKVAEGSGANGATITLAEANSSGLTLTVVLGTVTANETDDKHKVSAFPDFRHDTRLLDNTETDHQVVRDAHAAVMLAITQQMDAAIGTCVAGLRAMIASRWATFHRASNKAQADIVRTARPDADGNIVTEYTGHLELGRDNMVDELTAGAQTIVKNVVAAGTGSPDASNQGIVTVAAPTMEEWAVAGTITLTCSDELTGSRKEQLDVTMIRSRDGEQLAAINKWRVGALFADPILGIRLGQIVRTFTLDSGADADFGPTTSGTISDHWLIEGESTGNTDSGKLYLQVETSGSTHRINIYRASTLLAADLVGRTAFVAVNTSTPIIAQNGLGLTGTARVGSAPTNGNTGTLNCNLLRKKNASQGVPDKITIAVTVTSRGVIASVIADELGYRLNSAASGAETINERYAQWGTFPAYEVFDV